MSPPATTRGCCAGSSRWRREAVVGTRRNNRNGVSLDHLVGAHENCIRHGKAELSSSFEVDGQENTRGLLDRQVGRLYAIENLPDEMGGATVILAPRDAVADQAAGAGEIGIGRDEGQPMLKSESRDTRSQRGSNV
jgi:hypothetical protein